jgi:hypothetical protein
MDTFEAASNQKVNHDKVNLHPLGRYAPPPPTHLTNPMRIVHDATGLGITFSLQKKFRNAHWPARLDKVTQRIVAVRKLYLSSFGRAFTVSSYALNRLLYHIEFAGCPTQAALEPILSQARALVDNLFHCGITGVPEIDLFGPPQEGGFGLLPVMIHSLSRHAYLVTRTLSLLFTPTPPPYVTIATDFLNSHAPHSFSLALLTLGRSLPLAKNIWAYRPDVRPLLSPSNPVYSSFYLNDGTKLLLPSLHLKMSIPHPLFSVHGYGRPPYGVTHSCCHMKDVS